VDGGDGLLIQITAHQAGTQQGLDAAGAGGIAIAAAALAGIGGVAAADDRRIGAGADLAGGEDVVVGKELVDRPVVVADDDKGAAMSVTAKITEKRDDNTVLITLTASCDDVTVLGKAQAIVRLK
jgi:hypothetical protein